MGAREYVVENHVPVGNMPFSEGGKGQFCVG